jgi:hypothetical protein
MQSRHASFTKRSANTATVPSGKLISRYETHLPSANSGNGALLEGLPQSVLQSTKENFHSIFCPAVSSISTDTLSGVGTVRIIAGEPCGVFPDLKIETCNCASIFRHLSRINKASVDKIVFMQLASLVGIRTARRILQGKGYHKPMKSKLDTDTTPAQKMDAFRGALRQVLTVSKPDLAEREKRYQDERATHPKRGPKPKSSD